MKPLTKTIVGVGAALLLVGLALLSARDADKTASGEVTSVLPGGAAETGQVAESGDSVNQTDLNHSGSETTARAFNCSAADFGEEPELTQEENIERFRNRLFTLTDNLAASSDLEHQLTAAVLKINGEMPDAIEDLDRLLDTMPENPVLHWRLLDACAVRQTYPLCQSREAEAAVISVLGSNGEAWAKIAHYRIKRGDDTGGLQALLNASAAAEFKDYWSTETSLLFRSLTVDANRSVAERLIEATGLTLTFPMPELELINQCRMRAGGSSEWLQACLAYGKRKEEDARTLLARGIGIGLQQAMYAVAGQPDGVSKADARENSMLESLSLSANQDGEILMLYDESIGLAWLQRLETYGEFAAREFLRSEVERVRQIPGYDPCPKPGPER